LNDERPRSSTSARPTPISHERRRVGRHRVLKAAKIAFGRAGIIDATVRNMSDSGACLLVASPVGIPETFELIIVGDRVTRPCRLVWRKEKQIGVEFTDAGFIREAGLGGQS
jgi:hypothetical protein